MKFKIYNYKATGRMVLLGKVKEFKDLAEHLPTTPFCKEIGISYNRSIQIFSNKIESMTLREIQNAADLLGVDFDKICKIAVKQFKKENEVREK